MTRDWEYEICHLRPWAHVPFRDGEYLYLTKEDKAEYLRRCTERERQSQVEFAQRYGQHTARRSDLEILAEAVVEKEEEPWLFRKISGWLTPKSKR